MAKKLEVIGSKLWVVNFYREQLYKFDKLGLGKRTENNVKITPKLIEVTKKRLNELSLGYDIKIRPSLHMFQDRRDRLRQTIRNIKNGQLNGNGAASIKSSKDISDSGHEGDES